MKSFIRTTGCGKVNEEFLDKVITIVGWVNKRRDHGHLIFIDLRDRTGLMQVVFSPEFSSNILELAHTLRSEYVISVTGKVVLREPSTINKDIPTGKFELQADKLEIYSKAKNLPFSLENADEVDEEIRLKYRYLDLRRPLMHNRIQMRHKFIFALREYLSNQGFYEVETPILTKNTAEGAREFLVPSRITKGAFYALPQSPQLYKQILMAGGIERYFQVARCFRDEDLRADRQPEFTQLDLEMSFINEIDIQNLIENLLKYSFKKVFDIDIQIPFARMSYDTSFKFYGNDKPDLRFEMHIQDLTEIFKNTELAFLKSILEKKDGKVGALCVKNHKFTRSDLDFWVNKALKMGAKGLLWIRFDENGQIESPVSKFLASDFFEQVKNIIPDITYNDTLFLIAGRYKDAWTNLGRLRLELGEKLNLIPQDQIKMLWIVDIPLLEFDEKDNRWVSVMHPFTSPQPGWESKSPDQIYSRGYDIVFNGVEVGGGSIRIHNAETQEKIFFKLFFSLPNFLRIICFIYFTCMI